MHAVGNAIPGRRWAEQRRIWSMTSEKAVGGWGAECCGFAHEVSILIAVGR
jgi:hypothetical protein